jgi:hypothetical protein
MLRLLLVSFIYSATLFAFSYDVKVSASQIQEKVQEKFPYKRKDFLMTTTIKNAKVKLKKASDRLYIDADIKLVLMGGHTSEGNAKFNSGIRYNKDNKSLFLEDVKVESIQMSNIRNSYKEMVSEIVQNVANVVLKKEPIYTIKPDGELQKKAIEFLKEVKIRNENVVLTFGF